MAHFIEKSADDWGIEVLGAKGESLGKFKDCWPSVKSDGSLEVARWLTEVDGNLNAHGGYEWVSVFAPGAWARVNRLRKDQA